MYDGSFSTTCVTVCVSRTLLYVVTLPQIGEFRDYKGNNTETCGMVQRG
jgi:hypothetical protein